jgi:hypothetical protein
MHRRLFVAHQHVLDRLLLVERVVDVEHRAAGVAPEEADAFVLQAADQDLGAVRQRDAGRGGRSRSGDGSRIGDGGRLGGAGGRRADGNGTHGENLSIFL